MGLLGYKHTEEAKKKMSETRKGKKRKPFSQEWRKKLGIAHLGNKYGKALKGIKRSEETKRKISLARIGKKNPNYGKHPSKETKRKMSESHKAENLSEETRRKLRESHKNNTANLGHHHSVEAKKKMSEAHKGLYIGENNPAWKGGITPEYLILRTSSRYQDWRKAVYERDNYTCQICGIRSGNGKTVVLEAHHKKSFSEYSELRFEISNGITLCKSCHKNNGFHKGIGKLKVLLA